MQNKHLTEIIHFIHVLVVFAAFISAALGVEMVNVSAAAVKKTQKLWHRSSESGCERTWLTLGWQQGKENKCTLPKSSAEASRDPSCDLHTALMSVPSAPSGQIPEERRKAFIQKVLLEKWRRGGCTRGKRKLLNQPTESGEAESAGGSGPLHVTHRVHVGHVSPTGCLPWKRFHSCGY